MALRKVLQEWSDKNAERGLNFDRPLIPFVISDIRIDDDEKQPQVNGTQSQLSESLLGDKETNLTESQADLRRSTGVMRSQRLMSTLSVQETNKLLH